MQLQNKNRIAYLGALTLLFSYAEMLLPRFIPFFRLGLANIVILLAFELSFPSFFILTILKAVATSLMGGTLFSPFFLISLLQSVLSGLLMYGLFHLNRFCKGKLISVYGISISGSALSALVQIFLSSLYLGQGTTNLLAPMLLFNTASGILTAFLSQYIKLPDEVPTLDDEVKNVNSVTKEFSSTKNKVQKNFSNSALLKAVFILIFAAAIFFIKNLYILTAALIVSFILQKLSKRKILLIPHISLWIFVILSCLLIPNGRVLFKIWNFSVTQGALVSGIEKALKLSTVSALSQCAAALRPKDGTIISLCLSYYRKISDDFRNSKGSLISRLRQIFNS